jgi:3-oxoacyl-[acyl-carrier protein] reductase
MQLHNKVAVVTGGSSGLGLSIVTALINRGCHTHIIARSATTLEAVAQSLNSKLLTIHSGDVTNFSQLESTVKAIGHIDILINTAGVWLEGSLVENPVEEITKVLDINLKGVIYSTKVVLPQMLKNNDGYIINVSSTSGLKGRTNQAIYAASKYGVTGFTQSLQEDLVSTNVKVAGFYPGGMSTDLFAKAGTPKSNGDWMDTDKVAEVIIFMLERDDTMIMDHVVVNKRMAKTSN